MHKSTAYLLILAAACIWGTLGFFVRDLTAAGLSEQQLIAIRCTASAAVMFVFLFLFDRSLLKVQLRDLWMFVGTGIVSFECFTLCYFYAVGMTSLSTAAILLYTSPIFVTVLAAVFFHEKMTRRKLVCLGMAFGGCVLVSGFAGTAGTNNPLGVLLGVLSGFFYGLYSIFGQVALRKYSSYTIIAYTFLFASIGILPFSELDTLGDVTFTPPLVLELLVFAVLSGAVAFLLYTLGMSRVKATNAAIAAIAEPVVAALVGVIAYRELLPAPGVIGIALVITAILLLSLPGGSTARGAQHHG